MKLRFDLDLVESIITLVVAGGHREISSLQLLRFQAEREALYAVLDGDDRDAAFSKLYLQWFREWNFEHMLLQGLNEFPTFVDAVRLLVFRRVRSEREEGADLYISPGGERNAVVALRADRFKSDESLAPFLRHEFMHLADMIRPEFGYTRDSPAEHQSPSQQRLARDRYRLLWAISIDGRLDHSSRPTVTTKQARWIEFERFYTFWPEEKRRKIFNDLWDNPAPKHADLMDLAADPRASRSHHEPFPGGLCPLCSFPTFDWADETRFTPRIVQEILHHFPKWIPTRLACNRCTEIYELNQMDYPATLRM